MGNSAFEDLDVNRNDMHPRRNEHVISTLRELGYTSSEQDPIVPAVAKLFHANKVPRLTVWPTPLAISDAISFIQENQTRLVSNPGNSVFVLPMVAGSGKSEAILKKYGSRMCAEVVLGGGPFMLNVDGNTDLVYRFLAKLGYIAEPFDTDISEAIDVFQSVGLNKRILHGLGLAASHRLVAASKIAMIHVALVLPSSHGTWQVAPNDARIRHSFCRLGQIQRVGVEKEIVFNAMSNYLKKEGLAVAATYNKRVIDIMAYRGRDDPSQSR